MVRLISVHERAMVADATQAAALLDSLSSEDDQMWPTSRWPAQRLDAPLGIGASGGHGPIRYTVDSYEPGRHVGYRFAPTMWLRGRHWLDVVCVGDEVRVSHVISARAGLVGWLWWSLVIEPLHDALMRDAFDNAERRLTGTVRSPARWSRWVRVLRSAMDRSTRSPAVARPIRHAAK